MTYYIDYRDQQSNKLETVFDIEYYLKNFEKDNQKLYYSEISVSTCPAGLIAAARDIDEKDLKEFTEETTIISELRCELHEGGSIWREFNCISNNNPKDIKEAEDIHYHKLRPLIEKRLKDYCKKYNMSLGID